MQCHANLVWILWRPLKKIFSFALSCNSQNFAFVYTFSTQGTRPVSDWAEALFEKPAVGCNWPDSLPSGLCVLKRFSRK